VIPKIAYSDMLHQHQVTPLLTLRYLQYLCELTHGLSIVTGFLVLKDLSAANAVNPATAG
ncbi:hypothetical protein CWM98_01690, partial [Klebsiella variicola]